MMGCNVLSPQIFWFRKMRRNIVVDVLYVHPVNIGMWFERFVIIVTSLIPRLPAFQLECVLYTNHLGSGFLYRNVRFVLYLLLPFL
jgi:hypothetical protein